MNRELQEKIQAWVDEELDATETRRVAELARSNPEARALADNLRGFRDLVRENPPERTVDASRDFYWSRIRQGIEKASAEAGAGAGAGADAEATRARPAPVWAGFPSRWFAWLIPSTVIAVAAFFALRPDSSPASTRESKPPVLVGHVVESPLAEMTTLTFYSSRDAMTVVWVGEADIL